jgi:hypothetical protein
VDGCRAAGIRPAETVWKDLRAEAGVAEISALSAIGTEERGGSPGLNGHGRAATRPRIEELCDAQMERLNRLGRRDEKHLFRIARCL